MASVEIRNIEKHYGGYHALKDINLTIDEGEFVVMVGPSGCGKSTLLKSIAGLEDRSPRAAVDQGTGCHQSRSWRPRHRHGLPVLCALSAHDGRGKHGLRPADGERPRRRSRRRRRVPPRSCGSTEQLEKRPKQLSGGQRQRVAIGRAITR